MKSVVRIITAQSEKYPEFSYYLPLIAQAKRYKVRHPDITIEICKSLFEGISKSIVERIDDEYDRAALDKLEVGPLVKVAAIKLRQFDNVFENDFVTRCTSTAYALGMLRNARGDISHGKGAPKAESSDTTLSTLSLQMTEGLLFYMLDAFFRLDLSKNPSAEDADDIAMAEDVDASVSYEDNEEFNEYIDELNPLDGKLLYSLALYQQYYEDYLIQLADFRDQQEMPDA